MQQTNGIGDPERRYDELYEQYGLPLEGDHWGEYLAVSPSGETLLGPTMFDIAQRAKKQVGPGTFLFRIGERAVGRWR